MSGIKEFLKHLQSDVDLQHKLRESSNLEDVINLAKQYGYTINPESTHRKITAEEQEIIEKATLINLEVLLTNRLVKSRFNHILRSLLTCLRATQVFTSPLYYLSGAAKK